MHARQRKVERAMGIEPTREELPELENKGFVATTNPKCDGCVKLGGTPSHVGIRERTVVPPPDVLRGIAGHRTFTSIRRPSTALRPSVFASQASTRGLPACQRLRRQS
jgi:hypothetical protein